MKERCDRRSFLKIAGGGLIGTGFVSALGCRDRVTAEEAPPRRMPYPSGKALDLASVVGTDYERLVEVAVESVGGIDRFVKKGDTVTVKPNIGWDRTPAQAATTHPVVVATLVKLCLEAGASSVKVIDNTCNTASRCYTRSGIEKAAKEAGAEVLFAHDYRMRNMRIGGEIVQEWPVITDIIESDVIINVPIAKHHGLSGLSLGMKNWLGAIGGSRNKLHQNINTTMVDLAAFFRPQLTVVDATRILLRNGPQGGSLADVKTTNRIIAGADPVAADTFAATLFEKHPHHLPFLRIAQERGLGTHELNSLKVKELEI